MTSNKKNLKGDKRGNQGQGQNSKDSVEATTRGVL